MTSNTTVSTVNASSTGATINRIQVGGVTYPITSVSSELEELKRRVDGLMGKPYYMKITCHNCGASLTIDSTNHLVKCKYCKTAYLSGTQLINAV